MWGLVLTVLCYGIINVQAAPETKDGEVSVQLKFLKTGLIEMDVNAICRAAGYVTKEELAVYSSAVVETFSTILTPEEQSEISTEKHDPSTSPDRVSTTMGPDTRSSTHKDLRIKTVSYITKDRVDTFTERGSSTTTEEPTTDIFGSTLDSGTPGKRTTRATSGMMGNGTVTTPIDTPSTSTKASPAFGVPTAKYNASVEASSDSSTTTKKYSTTLGSSTEKTLTTTNATTLTKEKVLPEISPATDEYNVTYNSTTVEYRISKKTTAEDILSTTETPVIVEALSSTETTETSSNLSTTTEEGRNTSPTILVFTNSTSSSTGETTERSGEPSSTTLSGEHSSVSTIGTTKTKTGTLSSEASTTSARISARTGVKAKSDELPSTTESLENSSSGYTMGKYLSHYTDSVTHASPSTTESEKSGSTRPTNAEYYPTTTELNSGSADEIKSDSGKKMDYRILGYLALSLLLAAVVIWASYLIYTRHQANSYVLPPTAAEATPLNHITSRT